MEENFKKLRALHNDFSNEAYEAKYNFIMAKDWAKKAEAAEAPIKSLQARLSEAQKAYDDDDKVRVDKEWEKKQVEAANNLKTTKMDQRMEDVEQERCFQIY